MVIDPVKVIGTIKHRQKFITTEEIRKREAAQLIERLQSEKQEVKSEVLSIISTANPDIFLSKKHGKLKLVWDEDREEISRLVGEKIQTLDSISKGPKLIGINDSLSLTCMPCHVPETHNMSIKEQELLFAHCFADERTALRIIELYNREKGNKSQNLTYNLRDLLAPEQDNDCVVRNTYTLGIESIPEPLLVKIKRYFTGEVKRLYEYRYSYRKVQKLHKDPNSSIFLVRLFKTLGGHLGIFKNQLIDFPVKYRKSTFESETEGNESIKLPDYSEQILEKVFVSIIDELSDLLENIEWYMGVRNNAYIPVVFQSRLDTLKKIEILGGFDDLHKHIESALLYLIGLKHPGLIAENGLIRATEISKYKLSRYPAMNGLNMREYEAKVQNSNKQEASCIHKTLANKLDGYENVYRFPSHEN